MFSRRIFVALAVALMMGSSAFAGGGGGTKKDATISIRNDAKVVIAVFVDPNMNVVNALPVDATQAQIEAAGGKVLNPGATVKVAVKAGTHPVLAGTALASDTENVTLGKGQTKRLAFTEANLLVYY